MTKEFEQFNFSKKEDQDNFSEQPLEEQKNYINKAHVEALALNQIGDTRGFRGAMEQEVPEAAESFINQIKSNVEKFPKYQTLFNEKPIEFNRMVDHRERELIRGYKNQGNWWGAKKAIERMHIPHDPNDSTIEDTARNNKVNRILQLEKDSGMNYDDIKPPEEK